MRHLLLVVSLLHYILYADAQNFKSGIITGISSSQVSGDDLGGFHKVGVQVGGFVNHFLGSKTKGQFSIYYIDKGSKDPKSNFQIDLSYVESSFSLIRTYQGFSWEGGIIVGVLVDGITYDRNGKTYDPYVYEDGNLGQFEQFDIGAKLAVGKEVLPKLHFFWELSNTIPFFPIQNHPAYVSILNKGKMNSLLCFSFRYLLREK